MNWKKGLLLLLVLWLGLSMRVDAQEKIVIKPTVKKQVYNKNVKFDVTVHSTNLQRIEYLVYSEGEITQTGTVIINEFYKKNYSFQLIVDAKKNNSNLVYVEVNAYDRDGSKHTNASNPIKIDIDKPIIEIEYDKNNQTGYYNQTRTATITIIEKNFNLNSCRLDWIKTGNTYKAIVKFDRDGEYVLDFKCSDLAGNKSRKTSSPFVIDKTKPRINISYDKNNKTSYYAKKRTVTIAITEKNFDKNNVKLSIPVKEWKKIGNQYQASYTFKKEGKYQIEASCKDLAKNKSQKVSSEVFYIDTKKPVVKVTGIKNNKSYGKKNEVMFKVCAKDTYYDHMVYTLKGHSQTIRKKSFSKKITEDGVYLLTVQAVDKSRQKSDRVKIAFTVNRKGSTYQLLQTDKVMIKETNLNKIIDKKLWITSNNKDYELKPNVDYKTVDNQYVISKSVFEEYGEGSYSIGVQSRDEAGNSNLFLPKEEILIDKTPPEGYFIGLDKKVYGLKQKKFKIGYKDNTGVESLILKIDGKEVKNWNREELLNAKGEVSYLLEESKKEREISFVLKDVAGISTESKPVKILVTTDLWMRYENVYKIGIGLIVILIGSVCVFGKNRT